MMLKLTAITIAAAAGLGGLAGFASSNSTNPTPTPATTAATLAPAAATGAVAATEAERYTVDTVHTSALFRIRHADVAPFWGRFDKVTGSLHLDESNMTLSDVVVDIDVSSIHTGNGDRDDHVRDADFFNARQYPTSTFRSTGFSPDGEGGGTLSGELTLHGVTRPVTAAVREISTGSFRNSPKMGFEAEFEFKRSDFGITKYVADDGGDSGILGNTVRIIIALEGNG